jgi:exportin-1
MHELHEGVQDMACETFITIAKRCHRQFVIHQAGEGELFVDEIIRRMPEIIGDLTPAQVHYFYEAMGHVIGSQSDTPAQASEITAIMAAPNETWDAAIKAISADPTGSIRSADTLKLISVILKTNLSLCGSLGSPFMSQLSHIYMDMLSLYRLSSDTVNDLIKQQGKNRIV